MSLKELILSAPDLKSEAVVVPEWATTVYVSVMNGHERSAWSQKAFDSEGNLISTNIQATLLVHCLRDDKGESIFSSDDIEALQRKNSDVLHRLFIVAKRLNGLGGEAVAEAAKNS
jgi:type IV secretory pathway VirJ component